MRERRSFSNDKAAVGAARRFVSEVLEDRHPDALVETAVLLTSEVVSNAVLHGRSAPTVAISLDADRVRVEVDDASPALPVRKHYGLEATTGRGLMLLETLADDWGARRVGSGKRVWFDLDPAGERGSSASERAVASPDGRPLDLDDLDAIAASFGEGGGASGGGALARAAGPVTRCCHGTARPGSRRSLAARRTSAGGTRSLRPPEPRW